MTHPDIRTNSVDPNIPVGQTLDSSNFAEPSNPNPDHSPFKKSRTHLPTNRQMGPSTQRYLICTRNPSVHLKNFWSLLSEIIEEPISFKEVSSQKDWRTAIESKVQSIFKNTIWDIIDRLDNKTLITAKWIFRAKRNAEGIINKLKARIVARGFQQKKGIDYYEVFAVVVRWKTILVILALAVKHNWALSQMDVITAFLNRTIHEDILMEISEGFPGIGDSTKICRINKTLYGLKQAPKIWCTIILINGFNNMD